MNLVPMNTTTTQTMSSREIAELVEARHDSVKRTVERLAEKTVIQLPPMVGVKNHLGQTVEEYLIGKRDTYIIVAQLCPEFTARLVDRWQELEAQVATQAPALPNFADPIEAAHAWIKQFEERQLAEARARELAGPATTGLILEGQKRSLQSVVQCLHGINVKGCCAPALR